MTLNFEVESERSAIIGYKISILTLINQDKCHTNVWLQMKSKTPANQVLIGLRREIEKENELERFFIGKELVEAEPRREGC